MVTEGDSTSGDKHTMQYTDDALQYSTLETYLILLTSVNPINLINNYLEFLDVFTFILEA